MLSQTLSQRACFANVLGASHSTRLLQRSMAEATTESAQVAPPQPPVGDTAKPEPEVTSAPVPESGEPKEEAAVSTTEKAETGSPVTPGGTPKVEKKEKEKEKKVGDGSARPKREPREREAPYVNPNRVQTGGAQRVCAFSWPCISYSRSLLTDRGLWTTGEADGGRAEGAYGAH